MVERSEASLATLRVDFDLYWSLNKARVSSAVAHALSVERTRRKELVTKLAEVETARLAQAEATRLAQTEAARLAQTELKVKEQGRRRG
ncbi:hypothetical protein PanWU01x14_160560 [Parasponia andersonii]|uniref:Uncharacterized protein n=1 Tax=Parasponia andersonii TaxID=3476 RepID=A0A2P5CE75_PARAD|nr:hypothetical protein PanWU01x14_160560 [Parasponia andersonii]